MGSFGVINDVLLILKDHSGDSGADENGDFDISNKFSVIEYQNAQPQSVKITLNARAGRFLTIDPIIKKRDRLFVSITEKNGNITQDVFHVRNIKRVRGKGKAISLVLTCPHQSENLWKKTISFKRRGKRISGNKAIQVIVSDLNANKASKDPTIEIPTFDSVTKTGNRFDLNTSNNYFFDSVKANSAIDEIKDIEQQPVEGGGSFEPMYFRYVSKYDHNTGLDLDIVLVQAFEQGFQDDGSGNFVNIPNVTLIHPKLGSGDRPNILTLDSDEDPEQGTNLIVIGDKSSGSYLRDWMLFVGAQDVFNSARQWLTTSNYKPGHLVTEQGVTYEAISSNTAVQPPSALNWIPRTFTKPDEYNNSTTYAKNVLVRFQDIAYKSLVSSNLNNEPGISPDDWIRISFAPTVDYSPLTKNRVQYWVNALAGAKHAATNNGQTQMIDANVIIDDPFHPRTYVRFVGKNPDLIPSTHLVDGNIPHGYKVLVVEPDYNVTPPTATDTGTGDFAGEDKNGITFAGNIAQYLDPDFDGTGEWSVFKATVSNDDQEVFDWDEGLPWIKNPCNPNFVLGIADRYVNGSGACLCTLTGLPATRASTWIVGSYALSEIPAVGKVGAFIESKQFECAHSVKFDNSNNRIDMSNEQITDIDTGGNSAVFVKSAPTLVQGGIDQNPFYVGLNFWSLWPLTSNAIPFGTVTAGETVKLPVTDFDNMDLSRKAESEWFGPLSEEYYPFQAYAMWMNLAINDSILGFLDELDGDFTMGIWVADIQDNIMMLEFPQARNAKTLPAQGDLSKLKAYKGVPGVSAFFAAEEPNPTVAFDSTEFIVGGIFTKDSFDTQGRYLGIRSRFQTKNEMKLSIDAYRMLKPLVATSVDESNNKPDVNIETLKIDKSAITSYAQLKNYILGLDKFLNFDRRAFTLELPNGIKIDFGDSVYFTDPEAISDSDDDINNTVKVVANKITITISKTKNGPAGIRKTVELVRRVWP